jgi:hypothetical protein
LQKQKNESIISGFTALLRLGIQPENRSCRLQKIPEILDNTELLYPFIVPDKKYEYWSVLRNNPDPDKAIIYESQMPDLMTLNDPAPEKGFFQKCIGENCFSYVLACEKAGRNTFQTNSS